MRSNGSVAVNRVPFALFFACVVKGALGKFAEICLTHINEVGILRQILIDFFICHGILNIHQFGVNRAIILPLILGNDFITLLIREALDRPESVFEVVTKL